MARTFTLKRTVTRTECPWLSRDYRAGEKVVEFKGITFGCVSENGIAVSIDWKSPFVELPREALEVLDEVGK